MTPVKIVYYNASITLLRQIMETYQKTFIELAIAYSALRFGEFTLKSGRKSPYFFNMGQFQDGTALTTLGECYASAIKNSSLSFDVLFGPAYKGIPLACTTAIALQSRFQHNVPYSFNRKEPKTHGETGHLVGAPLKGNILLIDDVITAGTAVRAAYELIQAEGAKLGGVIVALDRQEKGQSNLSAIQEIQQNWQIPVVSLITFDDVLQYVSQNATLATHEAALLDYRRQYGVTQTSSTTN